jgi:hypothetical protein
MEWKGKENVRKLEIRLSPHLLFDDPEKGYIEK